MLSRKAAISSLVIIVLGGALGTSGTILWHKSLKREESIASIQINSVLVPTKPLNTDNQNDPNISTGDNSETNIGSTGDNSETNIGSTGDNSETNIGQMQAKYIKEQLDHDQILLDSSNEKNEPLPDKNIKVHKKTAQESIFQPTHVENSTHPRSSAIDKNTNNNIQNTANIPASDVQMWQINAVKMLEIPIGSYVAVVIDDAGVDRKRTRQAMALVGPLTFSFLPYAHSINQQIDNAKRAGHEVLAHIPMEPLNSLLDTGPNSLNTGLTDQEIKDRLDWALSQTPGVVGINNHMGSLFTSDARGMKLVMGELRRRGLLFLDSRTTPRTLGAKLARLYQVPFAVRNVFLDHNADLDSIHGQLEELEALAKRRGYAVAIGHPKDTTIEALAQWLPVVAEKGLVLVPISVVVAKSNGRPMNFVKLSNN